MSRSLQMLNMVLGQNLTKEHLLQLGSRQSILNCKILHDGSLVILDTTKKDHATQILKPSDSELTEETSELYDLPILAEPEKNAELLLSDNPMILGDEESAGNYDKEIPEIPIVSQKENMVDAEPDDIEMVFVVENEPQLDQSEINSLDSPQLPEVLSETLLTPKKAKSKRLQVNKNEWKVQRNANRREKGQQYKSKKICKSDNRWKYDLIKPAKTIKPRCNCSLSIKASSIIKCNEITEEDRLAMFNEFWALTWGEKAILLKGLTQVAEKQRIRLRSNNNHGISRRTNSVVYFLRKANNTSQYRVCKNMFSNTFSLSHRTILNWLKEKSETKIPQVLTKNSKQNLTTFQTKSKVVKDSLLQFFGSLAKMESHYCRASSSKMYLEPEWKSKSRLYAEYKNNWCAENNVTAASITMFSYLFERQNLSLFQPKKDQCDICVGHQTKNIEGTVYEEHQTRKKLARAEKMKDKESNLQNVFTIDLQSVLLCPKSNVSSLYYKTKLMVHNFTIYNLKTHDGYCFLWHEGEGGLGANEFSSILSYFILNVVLPDLKDSKEEIIFYSDGCAYQNRNSTLANALLNITMTTNVSLVQKILEKGHTQMEVDSMHSVIERQIKNRTINVPGDYVEICRKARLHPKPYIVQYLDHTFFKNFNGIKFYNSIRPGKSVGDATVNQIRAIKYNPDGQIQLKLGFDDEWFCLPQRFNHKIKPVDFEKLPRLYNSRLPIKKVKYDHLQALKSTMPNDYHSFYDNLPYV